MIQVEDGGRRRHVKEMKPMCNSTWGKPKQLLSLPNAGQWVCGSLSPLTRHDTIFQEHPMMPNNPKIVEAIMLACLEPNPITFRRSDESDLQKVKAAIRRGTDVKGAGFREPVNRNSFLLACLDFTEVLPEEHLIVGYGYRHGQTTRVERIHHVAGEQRQVSIPTYVREEIQRHHYRRTDAEVIVFHNHPRNGTEPEWFYTLKSMLQDLPVASTDDRRQLQQHAFNPVAFLRQLLRQGRVLFYLGESGFVKEFKLPPLLPFLEQLNAPASSAGSMIFSRELY